MARQLTNLLIRSVYIPAGKNISYSKDPILLICRRSLFLFCPTVNDLKQLERSDWVSTFSSSDLMAVTSRFTGRTFFKKELSCKAISSILLKQTIDSLKKICPESRIIGPYPSDSCIVRQQDHRIEILDHDHLIYKAEGINCTSLGSSLQSSGFTVTHE